ncbi:MFS transporter [Aspergillus homomorphus CBS 101889]|uniref:MFS general substrate transporter n=1 Tax=Aspergillus homomorphus (strain CBS 101889) TaxID=1450537 RepID=A0A395HG90_ASPHC|nr:MFS general substrate transporter [Aspergillus homomorphus CBS 101889]RAL06922.1 MFS general substrate transporter [Aspergillus homomorphus CBS 101889]
MSTGCPIKHDPKHEDAGTLCPDIADWDGPDDSANPMNWSAAKKIMAVGTVSVFNFLTPLGSAMFAPGVSQVMNDFHSTSKPISTFVVSIYLLGFACGPLLVAPLSELYGRLPLYHACNMLFTAFNIACAVAPGMSSLIGFRFLAGSFGSAPLALGAGTLADCIAPDRRGLAIAVWAVGPVIGPVVGPVCGGFLTQNASWRWVFWVIAIAAGVVTAASFIILRETYAPILLERKAKRLRREAGNYQLRSALHRDLTPRALFTKSIVLPLQLLVLSPIVSLLSIYVAVVYGFMYLLFTTMSQVYHDQYNFSTSIIGLTYIGLGLGSILGLIAMGRLSDPITRHLAAQSKEGVKKPEFRLALMIPMSLCLPIGLVWYGWSADKQVHWIMPIIGTGWVGVGVVAVFTAIQTYLVEAFTAQAASAAAANTVLRSLIGAVLPLAGPSMYDALGLGWGNSLLALIALIMVPLPLAFFKFGERLRTKFPIAP